MPKPIEPWIVAPTSVASAAKAHASHVKSICGPIRPDLTSRGRAEARPYTDVVTRRFFVRTFGCQMNEHDSERIAGLARGRGDGGNRRSRGGRRRGPQHVLHPRERRQQAVRPSRSSEVAEGRAARPADRGRRLPRAEGPRRRPRQGAARRRRVRHAQPRPRARAPRAIAPERTDRRDPRRARGVSVGVAGSP